MHVYDGPFGDDELIATHISNLLDEFAASVEVRLTRRRSP